MADPVKSPSFTWAGMVLAVLASALLAIFPWWYSSRAPTLDVLTSSGVDQAIQQALGEAEQGFGEDAGPETSDALRTRSFRPHEIPMSEFIKAGGACKCLVLNLR